VVDLSDEPSMQQLLDLEVDELLALKELLLDLLLDGPDTRTDRESVLNHFPGDPGHVGRLPCKNIDVCPEEGDECEFLFGPQAPIDAGSLGGLGTDLHYLHGDLPSVVVCRGAARGRRRGLGASCGLHLCVQGA